MIFVPGGTGCVQFNPDEPADRLLEGFVLGIDDVDTLVGAIGEVILGAIRIYPADVKRLERIPRYRNCRQALGLSCRWCAWALTLCHRGDGIPNQQSGKPHRTSKCRARKLRGPRC